jgi:hypothetical protein
MKKNFSNIRTMAALLMAGAAFVSCTDNFIDESSQSEVPVQQVYKMTVNASKGDDTTPSNRALSLDRNQADTKNVIKTKWANTDQVAVFPSAWSRSEKGMLNAAASANGSTTLTGELTTAPAVNDNLKLLFPRATWSYTGQSGVLLSDANSIEKKYDYALAEVTVNEVTGNKITTTGDASFTSQQAIVKFKFQDKNGNAINSSGITISAVSNKLVTGWGYWGPKEHTYTGGYQFDAGSNEDVKDPPSGPNKLVDGDKSTKWCTGFGAGPDFWYCQFHTAEPIIVDGYTLTTGDDTQTYSGRNPQTWELMAKRNPNDEWTTIANVKGDVVLQAVNSTPFDFDVDIPGEYQYFYFKMHYKDIQPHWVQLSELELFRRSTGAAYGNLSITPGTSTDELTVALRNENNGADKYLIKVDVDITNYGYKYPYRFSKNDVTFENGKYYEITLKLSDENIAIKMDNAAQLYSYLTNGYTRISEKEAQAIAYYFAEKTGKRVSVVYKDKIVNNSNYVYWVKSTSSPEEPSPNYFYQIYDHAFNDGDYDYDVYIVP